MINPSVGGFLSAKVDPIKNRRYKSFTITGGIGTIPVDGVHSPVNVTLKGQTATNIVANGNFANGTTGWTATAGSTISAASNVLSITGAGSAQYAIANKVTDVISAVGKKVYFRCLARVTNANCTSLEFIVDGAVDGTSQSTTQASPVQNQWYTKSFIATQPEDVSGKVDIKILHSYVNAATANEKVMEVKKVIAIDLTTMGLDTLTAAQCDAKFANWFDGTKSTVGGCLQRIKKNWFDGNAIVKNMPATAHAYFIEGESKYYADYNGSVANSYPKIKLKANTQYTISFTHTGSHGFGVYRVDGTTVSVGNLTFTTVGDTEYRIALINSNGVTNPFYNVMIRESSVAAVYEAYDSVEAFVNPQTTDGTLKSVGSGATIANDEVCITSGLVTQKNSEEVSFDGSKVALYSEGSATDLVQSLLISALYPNMKVGSDTAATGQVRFDSNIPEISAVGWDNVANVGKYFLDSNRLNLVVTKGTHADVAAAQAYYNSNPEQLTYQLLNPDVRKKNIYIEYGITNPITAKAGDTIIWTPTGDPTDTTTPEIIVEYGV